MSGKVVFMILAVFYNVFAAAIFAQRPEIQWTRAYGDTIPGHREDCWGAVETPDGGLALVGTYIVQGYSTNLFVMRIDSAGDSMWFRIYYDLAYGRAICTTPDNGFMVTGYIIDSTTIPYIMKIDSSGNEIWFRSYSTWGEGLSRSVHRVGDDGYILAGYFMRSDPYDTDALLVRVNSMGDTLWSRGVGGDNGEMAWSARATNDGGFIAVAWTESYGNGGSDFYIIKTDSNGDSVWTRIYGDAGNDEGREILEIDDEGYIFAGKSTAVVGNPHYYMKKIDQQGNTLWSRTYYFSEAYHRIIHSFIRLQDGGYELTGYTTDADIDILRTNDQGDSLWSYSFLSDPVIRFKSTSIIQAQDGGVFVVGYNEQDIWVVKFAREITGIDDDVNALPDNIALRQNYPNPFNAKTSISFELSRPGNITLTVYDLVGRRISILADRYFEAGRHNITFDASKLASGIYFYNLKSGNYSESKSMILLK